MNLQRAWITIIHSAAQTQNWFKQHEHNLGNSHLLILLCFVSLLLLSGLTAVLRGFDQLFVSRIIDWIVVFISAIFVARIYYKLRDFDHDCLGIRREMTAISICGITCSIIGSGVVILWNIGILDEDLYNLCWSINVCISLSVVNILVTIYPRKLNEIQMEHIQSGDDINSTCYQQLCGCGCGCCGWWGGADSAIQVLRKHSRNLAASVRSKSNESDHSSPTVTKRYTYSGFGRSWANVVCTPFGYQSFMNHLEKEFAIESLLLVSEVCTRIQLHSFVCIFTGYVSQIAYA